MLIVCFSMPMWLVYNCFNACCCNTLDITIHQPLTATPSITAMSSQNIQYVMMYHSNWSSLSGHSCMIYSMSCWRCCSYDVTSFSSLNVIHSGTLVVNCMALMFICMPLISLYLFSSWFWLDSQSAMNKSGPRLFMILTLYWCILNRIHWSLCDNVARSFLNMAKNDLLSMIILTSLAKQYWWNFQGCTVCPVFLFQCCCISSLPHGVLAG